MLLFLPCIPGTKLASIWHHIMFKSSTISLASLVLLTSCNYRVNCTIFGGKKCFWQKSVSICLQISFGALWSFLKSPVNNSVTWVQIMKHHVMPFSRAADYVVPLGSSCFPWHPLLEHHKPMFHTKCGTRNQAWPKNRHLPIDYSISCATWLNLNRLQQRGTLLLSKHVTQCCCSPAVVTSAVCSYCVMSDNYSPAHSPLGTAVFPSKNDSRHLQTDRLC